MNSMLATDKVEGVTSLCESVTTLTQRERELAAELEGVKKENAQLRWSLRDSATKEKQRSLLQEENGMLHKKVRILEGEAEKLEGEAEKLAKESLDARKAQQTELLQQNSEREQVQLNQAKDAAAAKALSEVKEEIARAKAANAAGAAENVRLKNELDAANARTAALVSKLETVTGMLQSVGAKDAAARAQLVQQIDVLQQENKLFVQQFGHGAHADA